MWTISPPLPHDAHLVGDGKAVVDVETSAPNANLAIDVYELGPDGTGPLITRQAHLLPESGPVELTLWSADWKIPAGHRIAVRVTETNLDFWLLTAGTQQTVTVKGGSISLPFLTYNAPGHDPGRPEPDARGGGPAGDRHAVAGDDRRGRVPGLRDPAGDERPAGRGCRGRPARAALPRPPGPRPRQRAARGPRGFAHACGPGAAGG